MAVAYILVQAEAGRADRVARSLTTIDGVTAADTVAGPYDVIARAEASSIDQLGAAVVARIQGTDGVTRTLTCPVVHI